MKIIKHFITITKHRHLVMKYCFKCGLYKQGLLHDLSKYSLAEFFKSAKYYAGTYSPITNERNELGYSTVWLHHKGRNKHHSEYWIDMNKDTKQYEPIEMPLKYVAEMFCDRIAASQIYNKKNFTNEMPLEYLYQNKEIVPMHPKTYKEIEGLLIMYIENGEKYTLNFIKKFYRK